MRALAFAGAALGLTLAVGAGNLRGNPDMEGKADRVAALIRQLGHVEFAKREAASKELEAIGDPALMALQKAADNDAAEIRSRARRLIIALASKRYPELRCFQGHTSIVHSVAFSPDSKRALSGSMDKTVRLWNLATGKEIHCFRGHEDSVLCVAFSLDGKQAISGSADGTRRTWDLETRKEIRCFPRSRGNRSLAICLDGRRVLWGGGGATVCLWDMETGETVRTFRGHKVGPYCGVASVAISPDGKRALSGSASGDDDTVRLWELETGKQLHCFTGHEDYVYSVAFLPDGKRAVSGGYDNTMRLWDLEAGKELRCFRNHDQRIWCLAVTPDGKRIVTGSNDGPARLWEVETGKELHQFDRPRVGPPLGISSRPHYDHLLHVASVAISPDGKRALVGGFDDTIRLWQLTR